MKEILEEEFYKAVAAGEDLDVWTRAIPRQSQVKLAPASMVEEIVRAWPNLDGLKKRGWEFDVVESAGLDELSPFGEIPVDSTNGIIKEGAWLRVKNGITMDSGSSVFVMPSEWLQMF